MVAINLFHQPSFHDKLTNITSSTQLCALLAAMIGYAAYFGRADSHSFPIMDPAIVPANYPEPGVFLQKALQLVDEAIAECDDEPPPICVVQALIIATHCQLTRGVHGKAWRSLGLCIRLAYELDLHLIDAHNDIDSIRHQSPLEWRDEEEKRRAWWAIWEMDVFASAIKRTPPAVSWTLMETYLPIDDHFWFQNQPMPSSFLERDPVQRWKSLQSSNNESPKAWYIIINSLMKDAQNLSRPHRARFDPNTSQRGGRRGDSGKDDTNTLQELEMLRNAVQCFTLALPSHLRFRAQYLSFDQSPAGKSSSHRQLHCHIYNIFVMTQLARLMIYRYDLFREPVGEEWANKRPTTAESPMSSWSEYFEAADNILSIVNRSCEEHVQHINPLLLSTIWLASAVQLVRKYVEQPPAKSCLIKSRFDVLYLTYKRCADFWDTKTALQQNLEALEVQLEAYFQSEAIDTSSAARDAARASLKRRKTASSWIPDTAKECADNESSVVGPHGGGTCNGECDSFRDIADCKISKYRSRPQPRESNRVQLDTHRNFDG